MAFGAKKIFPIDTKPSTAVGISIPFNAPSVFNLTYSTKDAIKNNILNFFLTNKTERYLNNNFGANLRSFLFEQITTNNTSNLKEDIQFQLNKLFPDVIVKELEIIGVPDDNNIEVILKYNISNTDISDQIQINFS